MKSKIILIITAAVFSVCSAANLIKNSDFSLYPKGVGSEYQQISAWKLSRFELFTENSTWNRCGKLRIVDLQPSSAKGHKVGTASVIIGRDGKKSGFKCKPNTFYRYSVQLRGSVLRAFVKGVEWKKNGTLWQLKECKKSRKIFNVGKEWTTVHGTFKTGPDAERAALNIAIWWDSQYKKDKNVLKPGDYLLIDNIKVSEVKSMLAAEAPASKIKANTVKAAPLILCKSGKAPGFDAASWKNVPAVKDFVLFSNKGKKVKKAEFSFQAKSDGKNIYMLTNCREPEKVVAKTSQGMWENDVTELFFAIPGIPNGFLQIAADPCGRIFISNCGKKGNIPGLKVVTKKTAAEWSALFTIPVKSVWANGMPAAGSRIGFNAALKRTNAGEYYSWNKMKTLRTTSQYGVFVVGGYGKGVTRAAYEKKIADAAAAAQQKKFAQFKESKTAVGLLSPTSDYSVPMAAAMVNPVEKIQLKAAVNEIVPMPVSIANLDKRATEYRVTLEAGDRNVFNGSLGLKNFPAEQIITRVAVRTRDSAGSTSEFMDPLPRINEASTILVPPGECGVVWFDINTAGVKPGIYTGVLRVTPLNKKGAFVQPNRGNYHRRVYKGSRLEIPVRFEVRNIVLDTKSAIPSQFFASGVDMSEKLFAAGLELGAEGYAVSPWSFRFPLQKDGTFLPKSEGGKKELNKLRAMSKKYNVPFRFQIIYSAYHVFAQMYGLSKKPAVAAKLWPEWIKALKKFTSDNNIKPEQFVIELFDEPGDIEEVIRVVNVTHKTWPELRNMLTLDSRAGKAGGKFENRVRASAMRRMKDGVDTWVLHRGYYFTDPEHLAFYKEVQAKGKKISHYTCETNPTSLLHYNHRLFAWFGEYHNLDSNSMYQLMVFINYAGGVDFASATSGNLLLMSGFGGNVIPTIRSMALRQGIMDVKYLALLKKIGGKNPEVRRFLKNALTKVMVDQTFNYSAPDQVREEAAQLILKLQKK